MYLDLGDPSVVHNEIIAALFGDQGFSEFGPTVGDQERVDNRLAPSDVFHVLDADSSQALAIHEAGQGRNMVIQGPPGTGKSQTIANVIADAVARVQACLVRVREDGRIGSRHAPTGEHRPWRRLPGVAQPQDEQAGNAGRTGPQLESFPSANRWLRQGTPGTAISNERPA